MLPVRSPQRSVSPRSAWGAASPLSPLAMTETETEPAQEFLAPPGSPFAMEYQPPESMFPLPPLPAVPEGYAAQVAEYVPALPGAMEESVAPLPVAGGEFAPAPEVGYGPQASVFIGAPFPIRAFTREELLRLRTEHPNVYEEVQRLVQPSFSAAQLAQLRQEYPQVAEELERTVTGDLDRLERDLQSWREWYWRQQGDYPTETNPLFIETKNELLRQLEAEREANILRLLSEHKENIELEGGARLREQAQRESVEAARRAQYQSEIQRPRARPQPLRAPAPPSVVPAQRYRGQERKGGGQAGAAAPPPPPSSGTRVRAPVARRKRQAPATAPAEARGAARPRYAESEPFVLPENW